MEIQDLRVGNWYMSVKFGVPVKLALEDFYELYILADGSNGDHVIELMFEPLEIIPDRLEAIHFRKDPKDDMYFLDAWAPGHPSARFDICWREDTGVILHSRYQEFDTNLKMRHIKYIHQIQDLYNNLTGEGILKPKEKL